MQLISVPVLHAHVTLSMHVKLPTDLTLLCALQLIIDPVCMLTCCPKLLHSFVYKVPEWGMHLLTPLGLMDVARYFCSRDLIIAEVRLLQQLEHCMWDIARGILHVIHSADIS